MQKSYIHFLPCFLGSLFIATGAANPLPRDVPEARGLDSRRILDFVGALDQIDAVHSFMIVRDSQVLAEAWWAPYASGDRHTMYSLSKSFTSTAVGFAVSEGKLNLHDQVIDFFPDEVPDKISGHLRSLRIRDLLTMSTGHHTEDLGAFSFASDGVLTREFLALPVAHKPGTHFLYNTPATYMCSAIVQQVTGMTVRDYLGPRLFEPLGIEDPVWDTSRQGISLGGFGLHVRTEDVARLGLLYLQKGVWEGSQLLPESWIEEATSRQTSNGSNPESDWEQGYGFQFWRCRNGAYRGDGAFGQFCIVMPEQKAVIAITSGTGDMQRVMNVVWDILLPAFENGALPENPRANRELTDRLSRLSLPVVVGERPSPLAAQVSGQRFTVANGDAGIRGFGWKQEMDRQFLLLDVEGGQLALECGFGQWVPGILPSALRPDLTAEVPGGFPMAASGAWMGDHTFQAKLWLTETPYAWTFKLTFDGAEAWLDRELNVGFGPRKRPRLTGQAH